MIVNGIEILVGADPELFVINKNKELVSGYGMIEGTKHNPLPVDNGAVQVDGMALEFNITPAKDCDEFVSNIKSVMATLKSMIPKGHKLVAEPVARFSEEVFKSSPEEALMLGCDPDFNAYDGGNQFPTPSAETNFRTASGHIHIGWTKDADIEDPAHIQDCINIVQQLDVALGIMSNQTEDDRVRRSLYGKIGCFRPKPYGVEYRTLSNTWLRSDESIKAVYENTIKAVKDLLNGKFYYQSEELYINLDRASNVLHYGYDCNYTKSAIKRRTGLNYV